MTEVIAPQPPQEWSYKGFESTPLTILSKDNPRHLAGLAHIDVVLNEGEFGDIEMQNADDALRWINRERIVFDPNKINFGTTRAGREKPNKVVMGAESYPEGIEIADTAIVAETEGGEPKSYVFIESPLNEGEEKQALLAKYKETGYLPVADRYLETSFVTADADEARDPNKMAEYMQQAYYATYARFLGKQAGEMLSDEEIQAVEKKLKIYAFSGTEVDETNYRKGLEQAGFSVMKRTKDGSPAADADGDYTYVLSLEKLHEEMKARANSSK